MAAPLVVQNEIVDHQRAAGFQRAMELLVQLDVALGRFLVRNVAEDRNVVLTLPEIEVVKVAIDGREPIADAVPRDELFRELIHVRPIELYAAGGGIRSEPDGRPHAGAAADVEP